MTNTYMYFYDTSLSVVLISAHVLAPHVCICGAKAHNFINFTIILIMHNFIDLTLYIMIKYFPHCLDSVSVCVRDHPQGL